LAQASNFHAGGVDTPPRAVKPAALAPGAHARYARAEEGAMNGNRTRSFAAVAVGLCALGAACAEAKQAPTPKGGIELRSSALQAGQPVPAPYACTDYEHLGKSPPLEWTRGPEGTVGYAV